MLVKNHLLFHDDGAQVRFQRSPNCRGPIVPEYLIMHYTACPTIGEVIPWFLNPAAKASSHLAIDRDGTVVQMVPFNVCAWHAGNSHWGQVQGLNQHSIGIELVNAGKLDKTAQGVWLNWAKRTIPEDEVAIAQHRHMQAPAGWQEYTEPQIAAALDVAMALNQAYKFKDVLGHDDVSPERKLDPGPLFPMISFRSRVLGRM